MSGEGSQEESLSTGLNRHLAQFDQLQGALSEFGSQAAKLKAQCEAYKLERAALASDSASAKAELAKLQHEVSQLVSERDALRLEYQSEAQVNEWWLRRDLSFAAHASDPSHPAGRLDTSDSLRPTALSRSGSGTLMDRTEPAVRDEKGRLVRQVHFFKSKCGDLEREMAHVRAAAEDEITSEQLIAQGLRERIGILEGRLKEREEEVHARTLGEKLLREEVKRVQEASESDLAALRGERDAAMETMRLAKAEYKRGNEQNETLDEKLKVALEEVRHLQELAATKPRDVVAAGGALRELSQNTLQPVTPTKPRQFAPFLSPHTAKAPTSPLSSLQQRFSALEKERDHLRKSSNYYEGKSKELYQQNLDLRERYTKAQHHYRAFKSGLEAQKLKKRAKKEEKLRARGTPATPGQASGASCANASGNGDAGVGAMGSAIPPTEEHRVDSPPRDVGLKHSPMLGVPQILVAESEEVLTLPRTSNSLAPGRTLSMVMDRMEKRASQQEVSALGVELERLDDHESEDPGVELEYVSPDPSQTAHVSAPVAHTAAPAVASSALAQPSRPLASPQKISSMSDEIIRDQETVDVQGKSRDETAVKAITAACPASKQAHTAMTGPQVSTPQSKLGQAATPLGARPSIVASRTTPWLGSTTKTPAAATGSGRRIYQEADPFDLDDELAEASTASAQARTPLVRDRGETSLRRAALERNAAGPSTLTSKGATDHTTPSKPDPKTPQAGASSAQKRKLTELDGLSPAERSRQLKKINALPASVKREVYADYKGKGRYLPPSEVKQAEFEIDPRRNEGSKYAFDDVKRGKEERKAMHGGNCECCAGYYAAVGPIPRYNQAPKWKDTDDGDEQGEDHVTAHQNQTSRHRQTWHRPPTPPGFWSTGFPTTQQVVEQNKEAERIHAEKEANIRREAAQRDGKWRKKA